MQSELFDCLLFVLDFFYSSKLSEILIDDIFQTHSECVTGLYQNIDV